MTKLGSRAKLLLSASLLVAGFLGVAGVGPKANAADADPQEVRERCAVRVSIALLGASPGKDLLAAAKPQDQVDAILKTPEFVERFARFVNSKMNDDPGENTTKDAAYHVSKYVLEKNRPWKDVYAGPLNVVVSGVGVNLRANVAEDPEGLGYFRSQPWLERYAGNEVQGLKISTAYRLMNNVVGLTLTATTNAPGADVSAKGRQSGACRQCHFDGWYALDKVASVLTRVARDGDKVTFTPPPAGVQFGLDSATVKNDKELVDALVNSQQFQFRSCRLAFEYLYGRVENVCEAPVFDKCIDQFKASGDVRAALATVAKDPSFCQ